MLNRSSNFADSKVGLEKGEFLTTEGNKGGTFLLSKLFLDWLYNGV
jgi:hypothetical protein